MAQPTKRARKSKLRYVWMALIVLLVGGIAFATAFVVNGNKLPWPFAQKEVVKAPDHTGEVAVPITAKPVAAFTAVQLEALFDAKANAVRVQYVKPESVTKYGFITNVNDIVGRVMARDKVSGKAFTEGDFKPKGTPASPTAGLDPGTRGMWVGADQIEGLRGLKRFDHFDLMAMKTANKTSSGARSNGTIISPEAAREMADQDVWNAPSKVLVQNGKIVEPLALLASGTTTRKGTADQMYIQVGETEADALSDALAVGARIICYSRTSVPGTEVRNLPEPERPQPTKGIEVIQGGKTQIYVVPATSEQANRPAQDVKGQPKQSATGDTKPVEVAEKPKKDAAREQ